MPVIIIVCILLVWLGVWIYNRLTTSDKVYSSEELKQMSREMIGKSQAECRRILKNHGRKK